MMNNDSREWDSFYLIDSGMPLAFLVQLFIKAIDVFDAQRHLIFSRTQSDMHLHEEVIDSGSFGTLFHEISILCS